MRHRQVTWAVMILGSILSSFAFATVSTRDEARLISVARSAIRAEVEGKPSPAIRPISAALPVFVTIEIKGRVVGCRGSLEVRSRSLEQEVALAARAAASHDPRYRPLTRKDLRDFLVTVTIVERQEPIRDVASLSPAEGLVLKVSGRTGIVLPWEGKDPKVRLAWAYKKAGVSEGSPCQLYRLQAERFRG